MPSYLVTDKQLNKFHEKSKELAKEHIAKAYAVGLREGVKLALRNTTFQGIWQEYLDKKGGDKNGR